MQEIIEQVLKTEEEAKELIQNAKKEAAERRAASDEESNAVILAAREHAAELIQKKLAAARDQGARILADVKRSEEERNAALYESFRSKADRLVDQVVSIITTAEFHGN